MKRSACIIGIFFIFIAATVCFAQNSFKEVKLNVAEKKLLNTFFSNFSEVFVKPFSKGGLADADLIRFGVSHNYRNNEKLFAKTGNENQVGIRADYVARAVNKYFGVKINRNRSVEGIDYKDGWYYIPESSGEAVMFSQVVNLHDGGNNMYTATVNVYSASSGFTGNVHGTKKEWKKAAADDVPELSAVMKATLRKVTEKGKSRYILVEYKKVR